MIAFNSMNRQTFFHSYPNINDTQSFLLLQSPSLGLPHLFSLVSSPPLTYNPSPLKTPPLSQSQELSKRGIIICYFIAYIDLMRDCVLIFIFS